MERVTDLAAALPKHDDECPVCFEPVANELNSFACGRGHLVCYACSRRLLTLAKHSNENDYSTRLGVVCPVCRQLTYCSGLALAHMLLCRPPDWTGSVQCVNFISTEQRLQRFVDGEVDAVAVRRRAQADRRVLGRRIQPLLPFFTTACAACRGPIAPTAADVSPGEDLECLVALDRDERHDGEVDAVRCGQTSMVCRACGQLTCFDCVATGLRLVGISRVGCAGFERACACGDTMMLSNLDLLCLLKKNRNAAVDMFRTRNDLITWNTCAALAPEDALQQHMRVVHDFELPWERADSDDDDVVSV